MSFRSGYIALLGRPNVGKTTLVNKLSGYKLGAVSPKPQTTRHRILAICTDEASQMIFVDTPGLNQTLTKLALDEHIRNRTLDILKDCDVILAIFDASREFGREDEAVCALVKKLGKPVLAALNKCDQQRSLDATRTAAHDLIDRTGIAKVIPISASTGEGLPELRHELFHHLPEGPKYYPDDTLTDQSERFIAAEIVREKLFLQLQQELPYCCAVLTQFFSTVKDVAHIEVEIIVDKPSQKGMVIGRGGLSIREIGRAARLDLEELLGKKVHLELFVKVHKNWRKDPKAIKNFGY